MSAAGADLLELLYTGKVRETYDAGDDRLVIVASNRISAWDVVMAEEVPEKGSVLTGLTEFWLTKHLADIPNHYLGPVPRDLLARIPGGEDLDSRAMLVKLATMLPVECIVRGYLFGSVIKEYQEQGTICGIPVSPGLLKASRLPEVLFTPSTKAPDGEHDENISFEEMVTALGGDRGLAERVRDLSLEVFNRGAAYALERGVILADTKFEWGIDDDGELILCDEVLTPDSSRFWDLASWVPGEEPVSYDKQPVREFCQAWIDPATGAKWNKKAPAPPLPPEVIKATTARYLEVERILVAT